METNGVSYSIFEFQWNLTYIDTTKATQCCVIRKERHEEQKVEDHQPHLVVCYSTLKFRICSRMYCVRALYISQSKFTSLRELPTNYSNELNCVELELVNGHYDWELNK